MTTPSRTAWLALPSHEAEPSLRLRGAPPTRLATPRFDEDKMRWMLDVGRPVEEARRCGVLYLFGDGSGGQFTDDPRRRRVGAGYCAVAPDGEGGRRFPGGGAGGLAGRQTVPRSELLAFALALESTSGK